MARRLINSAFLVLVVLSALSLTHAQTTTPLTVNNASASGDIADFVTGGTIPTTKAAFDSSGDLLLFGGSGGTNSISFKVPSIFTSYNFNLPSSAGSSGQPLLSGGGSSTAMTFGTLGPTGGGTGSTNGAISTLCAGTTTTIASGGTVFVGFGTGNTTEPNAFLPVPITGTAVAMHVQVSALPPYSVEFHARYNGGSFSPDVKCTINTTGNTWCDATGSQAISEGSGNNWDIEAIASTGTASSRNYAICLKVTGAS